jgi:cystathionine beta-lyase/cystathionine gamma-synthase
MLDSRIMGICLTSHLLRFSVGLENVEDLLTDLDEALRTSC